MPRVGARSEAAGRKESAAGDGSCSFDDHDRSFQVLGLDYGIPVKLVGLGNLIAYRAGDPQSAHPGSPAGFALQPDVPSQTFLRADARVVVTGQKNLAKNC